MGDDVGSEEGRTRGGASAPEVDAPAVHRVIDLAALERERERHRRPAPRDGDTWTVTFDPSHLEPVAGGERARVDRVLRRLKVVTTVSIIAMLALAAVAAISYRRGTTWQAIALDQRARGEALQERVLAARRAVQESGTAVERAMEARAAAEAAREAASGQLTTSEEDVAALEERIAQLAGEKARLEDELAVAGQAVRTDAGEMAALQECISAINGWLDRAPTDGQVPSWELWSGESVEWEAGCEMAMEASGP